jgi:hypothetical protein
MRHVDIESFSSFILHRQKAEFSTCKFLRSIRVLSSDIYAISADTAKIAHFSSCVFARQHKKFSAVFLEGTA